MKGIDPYIETGGACHSSGRVVLWGRGDVGLKPWVLAVYRTGSRRGNFLFGSGEDQGDFEQVAVYQ